MPTPVSNVKDILLNWDSITVQSPLITAVILGFIAALTIWLLFSLYYRIKTGSVRRRLLKIISASEQERMQLSETLSVTAQQGQAVELELSSQKRHFEQLKNVHEAAQGQINRALEQERQITTDLAALQTRFFLNEPLPEKADGNNTSLAWQRYRSVVNELTGRLQTYAQHQLELHQEKSKLNTLLTEQALTIQALQQEIATQTTQFNKREQDFAAHQSLMNQQQEQLKADLLQAMDKLQKHDQLVGQTQSGLNHLQPAEIEASTPINEHANHNGTALGHAIATDQGHNMDSQQAEATVQDIFNTFTAGVNSDFQQAIAEEPVGIIASKAEALIPDNKENFSKVENVAILSSQLPAEEANKTQVPGSKAPMTKLKHLLGFGKSAVQKEADDAAAFLASKLQPLEPKLTAPQVAVSSVDPLPGSLAVSKEQLSESVPATSKFKKIFGRFSKSAIVDYVETALEENDAKVAEQLTEETNTESKVLPAKTKRFWPKFKITN